MRRFILFLITLLATAMLWPVSVWAYTGTGTEGYPYLVDKWADLKTCMAAGGYIKLMGDCTDPNPTNLTYLSVPANKTVTLDLNGYMINRGLESDIYMGFVIVVSATGTLIIDDSYNGPFDSNHADRIHDISGGETINGGLITGGKNIRQTGYNYNVGGGINNLGTLILNKGTIAGNSTNEYGGGVYVAKDYNNYSNPSSSNSSFTMNGGAILYNSSQIDGGGIYLSSGTFTMNGGTVGGNSSIDGNGGGIYHISGTLSLTGGTIENNTCNANKYGGGIYRNTNNTFNISGNPIVRNNKKGDLETGSTNNLCLNYDNYDNSKITVNGALSENAQIGIFIKKTNLDSRVFTTGLNTYGVSESFSSDDSNYTITTNNGEAKIITNWLYLKDRFSAGGDITLDRDYISNNSEEWLVVSSGKEVILDLNGYKIDRNKKSAAASGSVIKVEGTLTIKDTYTGTDRVHPITVDGKSVDIVGGLITGGNSSGNYGGGITNAGTLILQSGTIAGNKAASGGGVFISNNKTFSMSGGTICYNIASNGGGVYLYYNSTPSTFSMNRGTISNNISTSNGGGIYSNNSNNRFEISGSPIITNNNQKSSSGSLTDNNVFLNSWKIIVANTLDKTASLGLYPNFVEQQLTQTLGGKGTESNFIIDRTGCLLRIINSEIWSMQPYTVTIADSENGSVSASATTAAHNDVITVTPHPDDGYYLSTLKYNSTSVNIESLQFNMPNTAVTISATFAPKTSITPTVSLDNWVYGNSASIPAVEGNTGNGDVSYLYKVKDAADDTYTASVPTPAGTYTVKATIAESAQYLGNTATADFTITPKSIAGVSIAAIEDQTYTGSAITPTTVITDTGISPVPTLTENTDYTLSYSTNNTNVTGENVTITVTGQGNYDSSTSTSTTFKIAPKALEDDMIAEIADQTYTGSGIEPEFTVTYNGMNLSKGTHYTAAFDNNTNTTDAPSVTITAADANYSGTASANFSIVAANLNTATVTGSSKTVDYDGRTSPAIDPLSVNFPVEDYKIEYRKTYQTGADVATIPTNAIGEFTVVLKPTDTGNLTGEKVTDYKVNVQLPINLKQCEWVTYFDERFDLATPTGYQAYKVSNASTTSVTAEAIDYIPKNVPVILKTTATGTSSSSMTVRFNEQQTTSDITGNASFIGIPSTSEGVTPSGTSFILVSDKFVLYEGTDAIPAHRCYLTFGGAGTRSIGIDFGDGGATGISDPPNDPAFEEQGQWYDLQGRRIEKPTKKGMYIKDGQKVVITGKEARL